MKNMAVGKKILMSFMAVILIIVILLGLTVITSTTRNKSLSRVDVLSDMLREATTISDEVNAARIELRTVFTSTKADNEYALAVEYLSKAKSRLDAMDGYSAQMDGYAADITAQLRVLFDDEFINIAEVHNNNIKINEKIDTMNEKADEMVEASTHLFDLAEGVTASRGSGEDISTLLPYIQNVLVPVHNLIEKIDNIIIMNQKITLLDDVSGAEDIYALLDEVVTDANNLMGELTTEEGKKALETVIEDVSAVKPAIEEVVEATMDSTAHTATAREKFQTLIELVELGVSTISTDVDTQLASTINTSLVVMIIMIVTAVLAVVMASVIATILSRGITRPLVIMKSILFKVGETGDMNLSSEEAEEIRREALVQDEIGQSMAVFSTMMNRLIEISGILEKIAARDLTSHVELLGTDDIMGNALDEMLNNLNSMFSEINSIALQVATASGEVSTGAQSLAQGSTEQASTAEEISAAVNEIDNQMNISASTAGEAANESINISRMAEEGSERMDKMMGAVQEINEASSAIEKVIKVIDDIAFQTNILALNAAVEAARAGEHGKGFAVVADEVRNLAGKSSDAAKETAALISTNVEKAEIGLSISKETAEELKHIVEGINRTNSSLQQVADQSKEAQVSITQVRVAVDQVSQVVQQNSATSEESAAASEEMNSQAQVLQGLISSFRLREDNNTIQAILPPYSEGKSDDLTDPLSTNKKRNIIF